MKAQDMPALRQSHLEEVELTEGAHSEGLCECRLGNGLASSPPCRSIMLTWRFYDVLGRLCWSEGSQGSSI